jgi:hypothetical protein
MTSAVAMAVSVPVPAAGTPEAETAIGAAGVGAMRPPGEANPAATTFA